MDAPVGGCLTTKLRRSGVGTAIRTMLTDVQQGKQGGARGELVHYYSSLCVWGSHALGMTKSPHSGVPWGSVTCYALEALSRAL